MAHYQENYGRPQIDEYGNPIGRTEEHGYHMGRTDEYGNPIGRREEHGYHMGRDDEHGNPIRRTDDFGNPVHHGITAGTHDVGIGPGAGLGGEYGHGKKEHGGILHRSGSSSSSSSEDDGCGGRRKKGMKEKIKEKLPGHKDEHPHATSTTTPGGYHSADLQQPHEKKGMMEKIKEKLPGHH